jgi:GDP-4-dehydro-6-deoxy-D-mannose reductase
MAVWLITGATGFVGSHVVQALLGGVEESLNVGNKLIVLGRQCPEGWPADAFVAADLNDPNHLSAAIERITPDFVIHTAGRTPPATDEELYRANFWATIHLLSALRSLGRQVRIVLTGSAAELGPVEPADLPANESHACSPTDAYGRSKLLATVGGLSERAPLEVVIARVFNPIGPGAPSSTAFGRFAELLLDPAADPLELVVGELDARRDFIDVRDVARAMVALALRGRQQTVYHVGTGASHRVGDGLDRLIQHSARTVRVRVDTALERRRGPIDSRADINRIVADTGWHPMISWDQSLADLWGAARDWRTKCRPNKGAA